MKAKLFFSAALWALLLIFTSTSNAVPAQLVQVTDSLGNVQTNSISVELTHSWPNSVATPVVILIGDQITFTAQATDSDNDDIEYQFSVQPPSGSLEVKQEWSRNNQWTWVVDVEQFGPNVAVSVAVRDDDGIDYQGSFGGDDYTSLTYDVDDPNAGSQVTMKSLTDSFGNVQTSSLVRGSSAQWPSNIVTPVRVNVGDRIGFTAVANSSERNLQYKFSVQPPGGSLELIQDWSSSNTATWVVSGGAFGAGATVLASVRNDDDFNYLGAPLGDDGAEATYTVNDPTATAPAKLVSVSDGRGNIQTNSVTTNQSGNWPSTVRQPVSVKVGEIVNFTAIASDPDSSRIEYMFAVQPVGGSFETRRGWSTDNKWQWKVTEQDYGSEVTILVAVRDNDGRNFQGGFGGDDYTYLTYRASVLVAPILQLIL